MVHDDLSVFIFFFFQAEDGIRDLVRSRGLGDVYKRQELARELKKNAKERQELTKSIEESTRMHKQYREILSKPPFNLCLLYTSDAADDLLCVDLGGRRIIKKKKKTT